MNRRITILGGGLAMVTLSACEGNVTQPRPVTPNLQPAAAHTAKNRIVAAPIADSAALTKKGRYAMGAN